MANKFQTEIPTRKAHELVSFKTGKLDSNAADPTGRYPFFTCAQETYRINSYAFDTECVLLAGNNAAGVFPLKFFSGKFNVYQRTYVIEALDARLLDINYLYYFLKPLLRSLEQEATGATTKFLTLGILKNLDIRLPQVATQRKIAAILSSYDDLIENNKRRIALLDKMAEELYREWFVRMRFPGYQDAKFVKGVPEDWTLRKLGEVADSQYGFTASAGSEQVGPRFLRITDIVPSMIEWNDVPFCRIDSSLEEKYLLREGDILVARTGATVGYAKRINKLHPKSIFASYLVRIQAKSIDDSLFIGQSIERQFFKDFIHMFVTGAAQPQANASTMLQFPILYPSKQVINAFNTRMTPILDSRELLGEMNTKLAHARELLLGRLISGKLSVDERELRFPTSMSNSVSVAVD